MSLKNKIIIMFYVLFVSCISTHKEDIDQAVEDKDKNIKNNNIAEPNPQTTTKDTTNTLVIKDTANTPTIGTKTQNKPTEKVDISDNLNIDNNQHIRVYYITKNKVPIFSKPHTNSKIVGYLYKGDNVLARSSKDWALLANGTYVQMQFLSEQSVPRPKEKTKWKSLSSDSQK